jgi:HKD family nuclease
MLSNKTRGNASEANGILKVLVEAMSKAYEINISVNDDGIKKRGRSVFKIN